MANKFPTLLDVAVNDKGSGLPVIDETIARFPEINLFPAATMTGATMELEVLSSLPEGSSFRNANEGVERSTPGFENRIFQTMVVSRQCAVDEQGVLRAAKDQARFLINRSLPQMQKVMSDIATQIWGDKIDSKGFPGLLAQASTASTHVYDVTGTAAKSSVWFLELGPANLELLFGNDQTLTMDDEWKRVTLYDSAAKAYQGLENWINGRVGLRLANKNRAVRIKNIGTATNKTLTDAHLYAALKLCEDMGMVPNAIFGAPRSFEQVRAARTATSPSGAPAPRLTEWEGIPVHRTTNISVDEA